MSRVPERDLYEHDFFAWTRRQSQELRRFARTEKNHDPGSDQRATTPLPD